MADTGLDKAQACNAFIKVFSDPEPQCIGPLNDLRISVKDNIAVDGAPVTGASPVFSDLVLPENKSITQLKAAGAVLVGKTNLHELAFGITGANAHSGDVLNPVNPAYLAGGSSAGAAVSVATGACDVAVGTDTGGSCRIPAAHCGIVGYRPSIGRYASGGVLTLSKTRDTLGLLAKDMASLIRVDAAMALAPQPTIQPPMGEITLGKGEAASFFPQADPSVLTVFESALSRLKRSGIHVEHACLRPAIEAHEGCGFPIAVYESAQAMAGLAARKCGLDYDAFVSAIASSDVQGLFAMQKDEAAVPRAVYDAAMNEHLPALRKAFDHSFNSSNADLLVYPTVLVPPVKIGSGEMMTVAGQEVPIFPATTATTGPDSTAGLPSITLPCGSANGLPVGMMLVAKIGADDQLLSIAARLEQLLGERA